MIKNFPLFFCTGFGVGFFPFFPGTIASFIILPVVWFIKQNFSLETLILGILLYYTLSIFFLKITLLNKRDKDPKFIVCDEYIGQSIALIFCNEKIIDYFFSFLLFRILDIKKPFPISHFDNKKSISNVLIDDIIAGLIVATVFYIYYEVSK
jgi:phosphatidylglycerophosphatase A